MYQKNNDLQRAIDEITQQATVSNPGNVDGFQSPIEMPAPRVERTADQMMPPMPTVTNPITLEVAAPKEEAVVEAPVAGVDVVKIRKSAMKELLPLIDRIEMDAKKRFELCRKMYETLKDKAVLAQALNAAKKIDDDKERAEALYFLVDTIDEV